MLSKNNRSYHGRYFNNPWKFSRGMRGNSVARSRSATSAKERPLIRLQIIPEENFTAVTSYALIYVRHYATNFHTFMPGGGNLGIPAVILDLSGAFRGAGRARIYGAVGSQVSSASALVAGFIFTTVTSRFAGAASLQIPAACCGTFFSLHV